VNHTPGTTTADNGGNFDPQQAAALLDQTTKQARRRIEPYPPWLLTIRAFMALAIFGTVWLSVRGQHPFQHPTAVVDPVVAVLVVVNLVATLTIAKRATTGVTGRSRLRPAEIAIMAVIWFVVFVVLAVLAAAGVSNAIVYGIFPATVPLMAAGLAWAGIMATRANWRASLTAIACVIVGAAAVFAGPAGAYLVSGVGLFLVLLGAAVVIGWGQRRSVVRP
jgi:hypothetical protein